MASLVRGAVLGGILIALVVAAPAPARAADALVSVGDEPALALTPPATSTADEDGLLDAAEIAQLKLDADWVILSACNTAAPDGKLGGQSLSGLARAFFYAGARGLLVSHWAVASRPTALLTTSLFEAYRRDQSLGRAAALRSAQLKLLGDPAMSHPALWPPFVLVGDGGTP